MKHLRRRIELIYLASPYSHPDPAVRNARYEAVARYTILAIREGFVIFSPIVYGHQLALTGDLPTDAEWWRSFNETVIAACDSMIVLQIDGWQESLGVKMEIEFAASRNIPVVFGSL
jgi:hypothetical protein